MVKQLKDLCIKGKQGNNLAECLSKYTKPQLKKILDLYGKKLPSAAKKQEMTDAAESVIKENVIAYLETEEAAADRELMTKLIGKPFVIADEEEFQQLKRLHERGMVFLTEAEGGAETIVPTNIVAIVDSMESDSSAATAAAAAAAGAEESEEETRAPKAANPDRTDQETAVIRYARALSNIYGVFNVAQLKDVWAMNHGRGVSSADVNAALEKAGDEDGFYTDGKYIVNVLLEKKSDYRKIQAKYGASDIFYYPPEEVVQEYTDSLNAEGTPEYIYLHSFLLRKCGEDKIGEIMKKLHLLALSDTAANELLEYLSSCEVHFDNIDDLNHFFSLYTAWFYHLRVWVCKGYMPCELKFERLQNRNFTLPPDVDPAKRKKIGRNDKCPCGSGKKYKSCCMKKIEA